MAGRTRKGGRAAVASTPVRRSRLDGVRASRVARALAAHEHRTAAALFALLVLVHLWPALVGGHVLSPIANLYQLVPWQGIAPADVERYLNPGIQDVPISYYPWDHLARQMLHAGTFPAWHPYALGGTPFFANPEIAWFSPFSLPLWILPLNYAFGVAAALKLWMAGFGTYLLVRELRLGFWPGIVAGVSFALCAFNVVWLSHGVQVSVAVLLPWVLWLVERIVRRGRPVDGLALAGIVAFVLTGGHPGTQLHVLAGGVLYALARTVASSDVATRERLRRLGWIGAALLVGALVTAVTLLPAQQAAVDTSGAFARANGSVEFIGTRITLDALRTALFPEWWGRPSELILAGPAIFNERTFFAGSATLVLALAGLVAAGGWRVKGPLALLAAIGVLVPLRAPGVIDLVSNLPLFDSVQNQRILLWFLLAVAVLAAFGLQAVLDGAPRAWGIWAALVAGAAAVLVAIVSSDLLSEGGGQAFAAVLNRAKAQTYFDLALTSVLWFLIPLVALAGVLLLTRVRARASWLAGGLVALVVVVDMLHFAHGYQPMPPAGRAIPPATPAISYLQRHVGDGRIASVEPVLPADVNVLYGLRAVGGDDPPQPSLRFYRLWRTLVEPGQAPGSTFVMAGVTPASARVLGMLGARYVIAGPDTPERVGRLSTAYRGEEATVYGNPWAMPRAIVAGRTFVAGSEDEEIGAVANERFDPRGDVVIRRDDLGETPSPGGSRGSVRILEESNASVTLRAQLDRRGVVVLGDAWAPGWSVRVDGRPARALRADVVLRGVVVPAGEHEIAWSYRVPGLRAGLVLSVLGLLLAAGWAGWLVARRRR